jgi:hypothetical protein
MRTLTVSLFVAISFCLGSAPAAEPAGAPAWAARMEPGKWYAISGPKPDLGLAPTNVLRDEDPAKDPEANPNHPAAAPWKNDAIRNIISCWCGGALAWDNVGQKGFGGLGGTKGSLLFFGGGHHSYYGNEVYAFDIEKHAFRRLTNPYPVDVPSYWFENRKAKVRPEAMYPDGSPCVRHTYDFVEWHPPTKSFMVFSAATYQGGGSGGANGSRVNMLALDKAKRDRHDQRPAVCSYWRHSAIPPKLVTGDGMWSAYDAKRDLFYLEGGAPGEKFGVFDPKPVNADGTVGRHTLYPVKNDAPAAAAVDPIRDILVLDSRAEDGRKDRATGENRVVLAVDLNDIAMEPIAIDNAAKPLPGGPPWGNDYRYAGFEWSPMRGAFLLFRGYPRNSEEAAKVKSGGAAPAESGRVWEFKCVGADWKKQESWRWKLIVDPAAGATVPQPMETYNGVYGRFRVANYGDAELVFVTQRIDGPVYALRVPEPGKATKA